MRVVDHSRGTSGRSWSPESTVTEMTEIEYGALCTPFGNPLEVPKARGCRLGQSHS